MQFTHIDMCVDSSFIKPASLKFKKLLVELAIRDQNYHVGTGLGGNNFQLLTLMNMSHTLSSDTSILIYIHGDNEVRWNAHWMTTASMMEIRKVLDKSFNQIVEHKKYLTLAISAALKSSDLRGDLKQYSDHFPNLHAILNGDINTLGVNM